MKDDGRKRIIILIAAGVMLALVLLGSTLWASYRAGERRSRIEESRNAQTSQSTGDATVVERDSTGDGHESERDSDDAKAGLPGVAVGDDPATVCQDLAPRALERFMAGGDLGDWFTDDADGSQWAGKASDQALPRDQWAGFLNTGSDGEAICTVSTGGQSAWIMKYRHTSGKGWLVYWLNGPGMGMKDVTQGRPDPLDDQGSGASADE